MAISYLERSGRIDPQSFAPRQQAANDLYNRSLTSQQPETHWAQGLARVLQSGISGAQNAGIAKDREAFAQSQKQDLSRLAQALSGGDYQSAIGELNNPDAQMLGLQLAKSDADRQNMQSQKQQEYDRNRDDKRADMAYKFEQQKQLASMRGGGASNPTREIQSRLMNIQDQKEQLQALGAQSQDPMEQQQIQQGLAELSANEENLVNRLNLSRGKVPKKDADPFNKFIGEQRVSGIKGPIDDIASAAKSSQSIVDTGDQILQLLAKNPNVNGGWGREALTQAQVVLNNILPGIASNVGDQQLFQKLVGQLTPAAVGKLRENGVQRITQTEIMELIPTITATMANDREGLKQILGLNAAVNAPLQEANKLIKRAIRERASNPKFDLEGFIDEIEREVPAKVRAASMDFMNRSLEAKGQRLIENPAFDPQNGKLEKFITVPIGQQ